VARDAVARGYRVVRLWSKELSQELREFLPDGCQVEYLATVEEADTIKATAKRLLAIFTPDAIICGAETGVLLTDFLSEHLGIATNGTGLGNRRDKHVQQQAVRAVVGLRAVREACGTQWSAVEDFVQTERMPIVLKPADSGGSDGVKLCHTVEEAEAHFHQLLQAQRRLGVKGGAVLCQEYLKGEEYVIDCVSSAGEHKVINVWKYDKRPLNGMRCAHALSPARLASPRPSCSSCAPRPPTSLC
jgi:hypothetical protein